MWFIDDSLKKNKRYYTKRAESEALQDISIHIIYGGELFTVIFRRPDVWGEICAHLSRNKSERSREILTVPDFDTSPEILTALRRLKSENARLYNKLLSSRPEYIQLRAELFPSGFNLRKI